MLTRYPELEPLLRLDFQPVHNPRPQTLTPAQIAHFNERGYLGPIPIFEGNELRALQDHFREHGSAYESAGGAFEAFHRKMPALREIVTHPRTVAILTDLLGPNVVCHISQYVNKPPRQTKGGGHHQDATFNAMDARCVVVWLAIEDADVENGCMGFIPGSHRGGVRPCDAGHFVIGPSQYGPNVPMPVRAGQALFFSDLLMHSSPPNRSATRHRPAFTATYAPAEVRPYAKADRWALLCAGRDVHGYWVGA